MEPDELARSLRELLEWALEHAPVPEPEVRRRRQLALGDSLTNTLLGARPPTR